MGMYGDQADFSGQSMGNMFPTNHRAGRTYWRRDLGVWCYDDGTLWLGPEFEVGSWTYYSGATVGADITTTQEYMYTALRSDYAIRLTRLAIQGIVFTTNGGGNYYKLHLRTFTGLTDVQNTPANTSGWGTGSWATPADVSTFDNQPSTSDHGLEWYVEKIGAPGGLRFSFALYGRLVYT